MINTIPLAEFPQGHLLTDFITKEKITLSDHLWIAGGFVRKCLFGEQRWCDVDIFGPRFSTLRSLLSNQGYALEYKKYNVTYTKGNDVIQGINLYYPTIQACLESFDFTICQFGFDGTNIYTGPTTIRDYADRLLVINKITKPLSTLRRLKKYRQQGFQMDLRSILKINKSVMSMHSNEVIADYMSGGTSFSYF